MTSVGHPTWLALSPLDTWFFGDGRPNNMTEDQSDLRSLFPPPAPTVAGAVRAGAARALGWTSGPWPPELTAVLGDGPDLGPLRFTGPFLARNGEALFPAPRHLLGSLDEEGRWRPRDLLAPGDPAVRSDLASHPIRLPRPCRLTATRSERLTEPRDLWVTRNGMDRVLAGDLPSSDDCVPASALFALEARIGLARDPATRTAREGALYSPTHVRLRRGVRLLIGVEGLPTGVRLPNLLPLGGESRLAACEEVPAPSLPRGDVATGGSVLVLLTPACLLDPAGTAWSVPAPGAPAAALLPGMTGRIESLCLPRPLRVGGWDSVEHRPRPLTPLVPAGTVWFLRETRIVDPLPRIGSITAFGYGHLVGGLSPRPSTVPRARSMP